MAEQNKNILVKYSVTLLVFAGIAGFILAGVFQVTEPKKQQNQNKIENMLRREVLPSANRFENAVLGDYRFVKGFKDKELVGYVLKSSSRGYSSLIDAMIGIRKDDRITGVKILSQGETPGLGTKAADSSFLVQFLGRTGQGLKVTKDGGEIDSITGATITSRAVTDGVGKEIEIFMELLKKNKK